MTLTINIQQEQVDSHHNDTYTIKNIQHVHHQCNAAPVSQDCTSTHYDENYAWLSNKMDTLGCGDSRRVDSPEKTKKIVQYSWKAMQNWWTSELNR